MSSEHWNNTTGQSKSKGRCYIRDYPGTGSDRESVGFKHLPAKRSDSAVNGCNRKGARESTWFSGVGGSCGSACGHDSILKKNGGPVCPPYIYFCIYICIGISYKELKTLGNVVQGEKMVRKAIFCLRYTHGFTILYKCFVYLLHFCCFTF